MKKNIFNAIICCASLLITTSCEKELPVYNYPDNMLNFETSTLTSKNEPKEVEYSFLYKDEEVIQDTVWVGVRTLGFLSDEDRPFEFEQIESGKKDAQVGVHFKSFDDPEIKSKYYHIPANGVYARVPIIVYRDKSLEEETVYLYLKYKESKYFKIGYPAYSVMRISITNLFTKPKKWASIMNYYFGEYGREKQKFMVKVTGFKWDDEFINSKININDRAYNTYLKQLLIKELELENQRREEQGLGKLTESDNTIVKFK